MIQEETLDKQLAQLTDEHQHGLQLCQRIRTGIKNGVELSRIKAYTDWYFETYLLPHLQREEQVMIEFLGKSNLFVAKSQTQHRRLKRLFLKTAELSKQLNAIEEELETNIRFEENRLFPELKSQCRFCSHPVTELEIVPEDWPDCFWEEM